MTDSQRRDRIIRLISNYTDAHTVTREAARAALYKEGIYDEAGNLRAEFGGDRKALKTSK